MRVVGADCHYGDDVRNIWLTEYVRWCEAFADYSARYKKWTCMQVNKRLLLIVQTRVPIAGYATSYHGLSVPD